MTISAQVVFYAPGGGQQGPSGDLFQVGADIVGSREFTLKFHGLQVIACFTQRPNGQGGFFTDEYSGNSAYAFVESPDGVTIMPHDSGQGGTTRTKAYDDANDSSSPIRAVATKLAGAMMGQGACWDTLDDGNSTFYDTKLAEARDLVLGA